MHKYSDLICKWLSEKNYTHCFTVGGGNIMHLTESATKFFEIIPVVNEVAAGVATEYFNETETGKKAFALVTAGPGLTNITTAIASSYLESRDLLVIGGQVKTSDLSNSEIRQRGIQEIDGVALTKSLTKKSICLTEVISKSEFVDLVSYGEMPRKAPIFIEIPLDIQAQSYELVERQITPKDFSLEIIEQNKIEDIALQVKQAKRPIVFLGGGVSRNIKNKILHLLEQQNIPIMTSWNAADRISADHRLYFGRPNTWGQRYANILLQQTDLLVAVGTRLSMQQTGFNWQEFIPKGKIIQLDCDQAELEKGHPKISIGLCGDADDFLVRLLQQNLGSHQEWLSYCREAKSLLPINEQHNNNTDECYISPYKFYEDLSEIVGNDDVIIPASSGGAFTTAMQGFLQQDKQIIITDKALASMGYGLSGAIGAAFAKPNSRTILIEGDGGFCQNLQELATVAVNQLNMKIFIFSNEGYASIRMTQKNYFKGKYVGCDTKTGLGFPDWHKLCAAYDLQVMNINRDFKADNNFQKLFTNDKPAVFIVELDPEQTYFPKIASRVTESGGMESNPLHLMHPPLSEDVMKKVGKYL